MNSQPPSSKSKILSWLSAAFGVGSPPDTAHGVKPRVSPQTERVSPPDASSDDYIATPQYSVMRAGFFEFCESRRSRSDRVDADGIWAAAMDIGFPESVATLVMVDDGGVSFYSSNGRILSGYGYLQNVQTAAREFHDEFKNMTPLMLPADAHPLPKRGNVCFYFATNSGIVTAEAEISQLTEKAHKLSALFSKGQAAMVEVGKAADPALGQLIASGDLVLAAAKGGDPEAQFSMATKYEEGHGVAKDESEAVKWFELAAKQGHARAQCRIGFCYLYGNLGVSKDEAIAAHYMRDAANQGEPLAQGTLGYLCERGIGVTQDIAEADRLYRLSADKGVEIEGQLTERLWKYFNEYQSKGNKK